MITPAQYKKTREKICSIISAVIYGNINFAAEVERELKKINTFLRENHFNVLILSDSRQNGASEGRIY